MSMTDAQHLEHLQNMFKALDKDQSGEIAVSELKSVFKELGSDDKTADKKAKVNI